MVDRDEGARRRLAHYRQFLGEEFTSHRVSDGVETLCFRPTQQRNWLTIVTSGMSDRPQPLEKFKLQNPEEWRRVELAFYLRSEEKQYDWVYSMLDDIARFPWKNDTFVAWYHSYSPTSSELGEFSGVFFLPPHFEGQQFDSLDLGGELLHVLWAVPITQPERTFAKQHGGPALEKLLWPLFSGPVFDPSRTPVA